MFLQTFQNMMMCNCMLPCETGSQRQVQDKTFFLGLLRFLSYAFYSIKVK